MTLGFPDAFPRRIGLAAIASACLVCAMGVSLSFGTIAMPLSGIVHVLIEGIRGRDSNLTGVEHIVWAVRLPRVFMAVVVGAGLGGAGAATQGVFRNPLADPYLLGIASGAVFGATVALVVGHSTELDLGSYGSLQSSTYVSLAAFAGGLMAVALTATVARSAHGSAVESLLLSGVVAGSVLTAASTYLVLRDGEHLRTVISWALGNFALASWGRVAFALPYVVVALVALFAMGRWLDALQLGDCAAQTLGLRVGAVRWLALGAATLATAVCVASVGTVGFVGLVAPHIVRRLGSPTHRPLIAGSALMGATLLVLADLGARTLAQPSELPVGVVLTLAGGPFFLWLLRRP